MFTKTVSACINCFFCEENHIKSNASIQVIVQCEALIYTFAIEKKS